MVGGVTTTVLASATPVPDIVTFSGVPEALLEIVSVPFDVTALAGV